MLSLFLCPVFVYAENIPAQKFRSQYRWRKRTSLAQYTQAPWSKHAVRTNRPRAKLLRTKSCGARRKIFDSRNIIFAAFLLILLLLSGCASNVIYLSYPELKTPASFDSRKNISVCVTDFTNKRDTGVIGERLNGEVILPRIPVERWLATSLAVELEHAGYRVSTAETLAEALTGKTDYIITGESEGVWLAETSLTRYTGTIRTSITLLDGQGGHITTNAYNCIYSKTVLPIYGVPQTLLAEALQEMLSPAVKLLGSAMQ